MQSIVANFLVIVLGSVFFSVAVVLPYVRCSSIPSSDTGREIAFQIWAPLSLVIDTTITGTMFYCVRHYSSNRLLPLLTSIPS